MFLPGSQTLKAFEICFIVLLSYPLNFFLSTIVNREWAGAGAGVAEAERER
jgi:hypothetical protein